MPSALLTCPEKAHARGAHDRSRRSGVLPLAGLPDPQVTRERDVRVRVRAAGINPVDCKPGFAGAAGGSLPAVLGWPGARGGGQHRPGRGPGCGLAVRSASATAGQGPRLRDPPGPQGRGERYLARESLSPYPTTFGLFNTGGTAQIGDYSNPTAQYRQAHRQSRRPARAVTSIQPGTGRAPEPVVLHHRPQRTRHLPGSA
jgi:hypothetical protein